MLRNPVPLLLPALPWLPIAFGAKDKLLTLTHENLCVWPLLTSWPSPLSSLLFPHSTPDTQASLLFLEPTRLIQAQGLCTSVLSPWISLPPDIQHDCSLISFRFLTRELPQFPHIRLYPYPLPLCAVSSFSYFIFLPSTQLSDLHSFYFFAYYLLPTLECQGKAFICFVHSCVPVA